MSILRSCSLWPILTRSVPKPRNKSGIKFPIQLTDRYADRAQQATPPSRWRRRLTQTLMEVPHDVHYSLGPFRARGLCKTN